MPYVEGPIGNPEKIHTIPGAPPGVVAMLSETREGGKYGACETCGRFINHPSQFWLCGAGFMKKKKGVRHPDGLIYWHKECLK